MMGINLLAKAKFVKLPMLSISITRASPSLGDTERGALSYAALCRQKHLPRALYLR